METPKVLGACGEEMALEDLKQGDVLLVYWKGPAKPRTFVRFDRFEERLGERFKPERDPIRFETIEFDDMTVSRLYSLGNISQILFCAHDSPGSIQMFRELMSLYEEKRVLRNKLKRIGKRLSALIE